jgi:hypothetical protein
MWKAIVVAGLAAAGLAPGAHAEACSKNTLKGAYGSLLTGTVIGVGPFITLAAVHFDGNGNWSYTETGNFNGNPIPQQSFFGTYTVGPDCRGSASDSGGNKVDLVIVSSGKEVFMVGTNPGAVFSVILKRMTGD